MARPKQTEHRRGQLIKLLSEEKQTIERNARTAGLTLSEYMRRCSLNKRLRSRISDKAISRFSSMFGLVKHLLMQIKGHSHEGELRRDLKATLAAIHATLTTVIGTSEDQNHQTDRPPEPLDKELSMPFQAPNNGT
jgi:hypothetical protein